MDFNQLSEAWRRLPPLSQESPTETLQLVQRRARELRQVVRMRDRIETGVALLMLPLFGWLAVVVRHDLSRVGAVIIAVACALIPLRLLAARKDAADPGQTMVAQLRAELLQVEAQDRLLSTVLWWYLAPLGVGAILFVGGAVSPLLAVLYGLVVVTFYGWLLYLNRRAARTELHPRAHELRTWISNLEQGT